MKTFRIKSKIINDIEWFYAEQFVDGIWIIPVNTENWLSYHKLERVTKSKFFGLLKWETYITHPPKMLGFKSKEFLQKLIDQEISNPMCGIYWHDWCGDITKILD